MAVASLASHVSKSPMTKIPNKEEGMLQGDDLCDTGWHTGVNCTTGGVIRVY